MVANRLETGSHGFDLDDIIQFEGLAGGVPAQSILQALNEFTQLASRQCDPQFAALVFNATNNFRALDWYFPITNMLTAPELDSFYGLVQRIAAHPNFDLRLIGENKSDLTDRMPSSVRHLVAGQLAEVFFHKQNILERFLSTPRHFQLYVTPRAFEQDGGVSGGDYHPGRESIQLVLSRLFEGFSGETAGVCPFLHELGHMLDHFDVSSGRMGQVEGLLPGASLRDGEAFNPLARKLFIAGKSLELERYLALCHGKFKEGDPLPIGHPYVFQNNGEFIAGYFEMFFRNPNYFAENNPDLYSAFMELFGYDPRGAWKQDFPHYVNQNRAFYLSGKMPGKPNLTLPGDEAKPTPPLAKNKNERWKIILYLLFVAVGIWVVFFSNEQSLVVIIAGWFGIVFFGFGAVLSIKAMLIRKDK
jgi:Mlc titration factor MtfA (ptsG expression regulator)